MTTEEERLWESIDEYGVTLEQVGYKGVVTFEMEKDGGILLGLGQDLTEYCADTDEAIEKIASWAEEYGADPDETGAIIALVDELTSIFATSVQWVEELSTKLDKVSAQSGEQFLQQLDVERLVRRFMGLIKKKRLEQRFGLQECSDGIPKETFVELDVRDIGFFEDINGVIWRVYMDTNKEINYEEIPLDDWYGCKGRR